MLESRVAFLLRLEPPGRTIRIWYARKRKSDSPIKFASKNSEARKARPPSGPGLRSTQPPSHRATNQTEQPKLLPVYALERRPSLVIFNRRQGRLQPGHKWQMGVAPSCPDLFCATKQLLPPLLFRTWVGMGNGGCCGFIHWTFERSRLVPK
jgi:hypothetical protein